jgi:hypothetical protein
LGYETTCMLVRNELVCDCFIWKTLVYNWIDLITKIFKTLILFSKLVCFWYSLLVWYECWNACDLCMHVCLLCAFIFLTIESNEECTEEGEDFEYQEEGDQGQVNQGKPSTWCLSESYYYTMHCLLLLSYLCIVFYIAIDLKIAIVGDLAPQVNLISSFEMTPLVAYSTPLIIETWWLSSKSLENL